MAVSIAVCVAVEVSCGGPAVAPVQQGGAPAASTAPRPVPADVLDASERAAVDRVLAGGVLAIPEDVVRLAGATGALLGRPPVISGFGPEVPKGSVLLTARPEFQWSPREGAKDYTVTIHNEQFNEVMASPRVAGPRWKPAADLLRGVTYLWQVTAHTASGDIVSPVPPRPEARFRVADSATAVEVTRMMAQLANRPLESGILLAERGFILDAIAAFERAANSPATSEQARRLRVELGDR